jgi:phage terminase Nu1 subunit (DNA packaging protein)
MSLLEHARVGALGLVNRKKLAEEMGVSPRTIIRLEGDGMPVIRRRRLRLYDMDKVRSWFTGGDSPTPARKLAAARRR